MTKRFRIVFSVSCLPLKSNMIQCVNRVFRRFVSVCRRIFYNVRTDSQVQFATLKNFFQPLQVGRVSHIDRNIVGEGVNMLFIGNGHIHNLSSHQARLCMLRPRKFIKCQIHVKAQVSNLNGNRFMAQAERVEGSRIKAHLARWGKIKTFPFQSMNPDIAINVIKHCRIVIKIESLFLLFRQ